MNTAYSFKKHLSNNAAHENALNHWIDSDSTIHLRNIDAGVKTKHSPFFREVHKNLIQALKHAPTYTGVV